MSRPTTPESPFSDRVAVLVERVVAMREERGMSQADVAQEARELGHPMHRTTLTKIEAGDRRPTLEDVFALAAVFRVRPGQLIASREEETADVIALFDDGEEEREEALAALERARQALDEARDALGGK